MNSGRSRSNCCWIFCIIFLLAFPFVDMAQDEKKFRLFSAADGLSDNNISAIAQDSSGYMWVATSRGLNRYDGKKFVQFHSGQTSTSLPDEAVTCLEWMDKNKLAVYTGLGMHIMNVANGETHDLIVPAVENKFLYKFNAIMSALSDKHGNVMLLTRSGFYHYDSLRRLVFRFDYYRRDEIPTEYFAFGKKVFWLSQNEVLVHAIDGAYIYDTYARKISKITTSDPLLPELAGISHVEYLVRQTRPGRIIYIKAGVDSITCVDYIKKTKRSFPLLKKGQNEEFAWRSNTFQVNDSVFYFNSQQKGFYKLVDNPTTGVVSLDTLRHLSNYYCRDFIVDRDNRWWVATNAGLLKEVNSNNSVAQVAVPSDIMNQYPDARIRTTVSVGNKLYVACVRHGGLLIYDKHSLNFIRRLDFRQYGPEADNVYTMLKMSKDTLLLGLSGPLIWMNTTNGKTGIISLKDYVPGINWVSSMFNDQDGNTWITTNEINKVYKKAKGTSSYTMYSWDSTDFKKIMVPASIDQDYQGNLWMGGQGIARINAKTCTPDFYMDSFPFIKYPRREVTAMTLDQAHILWFGVNNNGLVGYNIDKKTFQHFTSQDGLPDDYVGALYVQKNKLWIGTATGIASMDLVSHKISKFSAADGFAPLPLSSYNFNFDPEKNYFYAGFSDHVTRFSPDSLSFGQNPPTFLIEDVKFLNDSTIFPAPKSITIPYNNNDMFVTIGTINFNDVTNERIMYRIIDWGDTSWKMLSGDQISFNNISPGKYKLQVKLIAANNRWPAQLREMQVIVKPPFYRTSWFIAFLALALMSAVYMIYRSNVNGVRRRERAKAQLQELKAEEYRNRLELEKISNYFSSSMSDKCSVDEVLWDVARNLIGRIGYTDCMIYMWNENRTKMIQKAGFGPKGTPEDLADRIFDVAPGQGVVGYVMKTKKPVLICDTRKDERYRKDDIFRLSEITVPIIHNDELLGVLDSEHELPNYYRERDLKILTTIATLVGNKIKQVESENTLADKFQELATINEQLAEAQLKALQTQMNPHFIFNALNSIKRMILDNENRNASRYLSKFAQMIRLTLNHSKETFVTLQETIEYLNAYLEMEQLRFGSSFTYQIEVSGKADDEEIGIPTLMIQPLVENAIWHGLMHREGDKRVTICFVVNDDWVSCSIKDNGIGIRASEKMSRGNRPPSVGLDNLRNRIKIMNEKYNTSCTLVIEDLGETGVDECGTSVILKFKIVHDKRIIA